MFYLNDKCLSVHLFDEQLSYPVMLCAKSKQESDLISNNLTKELTQNFGVLDFINWSKANGIDYQVLFPNDYIKTKPTDNSARLLRYYTLLNSNQN